MDCLGLTDPSNGQVFLATTILGSVATYTCEDGYMLMGIAMRECLASGSWSQQEPVCESKLPMWLNFCPKIVALSFQLLTVVPFLILTMAW